MDLCKSEGQAGDMEMHCHNLMLNLLYCTLDLLGLSPSVFWEYGMFPCLWHWTSWVVSTVNRKYSGEMLWGGEVVVERHEGLWLCCPFHRSLKTDESHSSVGVHCCRDILTTSQQEKDEQKSTPGANNIRK